MGLWDRDTPDDGRMTKEAILKVCKQKQNDGMWRTPELNDKLYLHFKGYPNIGGLEEYVNVRCLWMEGNAISKIEGLERQADSLRTLFLHQNCIQEMEGLDHLKLLDTVNLSDNFIGKIEHLSGCTQLRTLNLKGNKLRDLEDLIHLVECPSITVLDVSENQIRDATVVDEVFVRMPNLTILKLNGNPCLKDIPHYRKTLISKLPKLRHLDDRPVFDDERRTSEAWSRGGLEEEKRERELMRKEADEKRAEHMRAFDEMIAKGRRQREENERLGIQPLHTEYWRRNHENPEEDPIKRAFEKDGGRVYLQQQQQKEGAEAEAEAEAEASPTPADLVGPPEKHVVHFLLEDYASGSDSDDEGKEGPRPSAPAEDDDGLGIETVDLVEDTSPSRSPGAPSAQREAWLAEGPEAAAPRPAAPAMPGGPEPGDAPQEAGAAAREAGEVGREAAAEAEAAAAADAVQREVGGRPLAAEFKPLWDFVDSDPITQTLQEREPHRPMVFGTAAYQQLWKMACALPDPPARDMGMECDAGGDTAAEHPLSLLGELEGPEEGVEAGVDAEEEVVPQEEEEDEDEGTVVHGDAADSTEP